MSLSLKEIYKKFRICFTAKELKQALKELENEDKSNNSKS